MLPQLSDGVANLGEDAYTALGIEQTYTTLLVDGSPKTLLPGGENVIVPPPQREKYALLTRKARMMENSKQVGGLTRFL